MRSKMTLTRSTLVELDSPLRSFLHHLDLLEDFQPLLPLLCSAVGSFPERLEIHTLKSLASSKICGQLVAKFFLMNSMN
jgi:hypothetical protein